MAEIIKGIYESNVSSNVADVCAGTGERCTKMTGSGQSCERLFIEVAEDAAGRFDGFERSSRLSGAKAEFYMCSIESSVPGRMTDLLRRLREIDSNLVLNDEQAAANERLATMVYGDFPEGELTEEEEAFFELITSDSGVRAKQAVHEDSTGYVKAVRSYLGLARSK